MTIYKIILDIILTLGLLIISLSCYNKIIRYIKNGLQEPIICVVIVCFMIGYGCGSMSKVFTKYIFNYFEKDKIENVENINK